MIRFTAGLLRSGVSPEISSMDKRNVHANEWGDRNYLTKQTISQYSFQEWQSAGLIMKMFSVKFLPKSDGGRDRRGGEEEFQPDPLVALS